MAARMSSPSSSSSTYPKASDETLSMLRVCKKPIRPATMMATSRPPTATIVTRHGSARTLLIQPKKPQPSGNSPAPFCGPLHYTCRRYAGTYRRRRPRDRPLFGARPGRPRPQHHGGRGRRGGGASGRRGVRRDGPPRRHAAPPRRPAGSPAHPAAPPRPAGADAHRPRRGPPQGRRPRLRGRRLPHQPLRPRGAPGAHPGAHPPRGPALVLQAGLRGFERGPPLPQGKAGREADRPLQPGVRPARVLYAPPWAGAEPAADPLGRLGLCLRPRLERGRRLRKVPAQQARPARGAVRDPDRPRRRLPLRTTRRCPSALTAAPRAAELDPGLRAPVARQNLYLCLQIPAQNQEVPAAPGVLDVGDLPPFCGEHAAVEPEHRVSLLGCQVRGPEEHQPAGLLLRVAYPHRAGGTRKPRDGLASHVFFGDGGRRGPNPRARRAILRGRAHEPLSLQHGGRRSALDRPVEREATGREKEGCQGNRERLGAWARAKRTQRSPLLCTGPSVGGSGRTGSLLSWAWYESRVRGSLSLREKPLMCRSARWRSGLAAGFRGVGALSW